MSHLTLNPMSQIHIIDILIITKRESFDRIRILFTAGAVYFVSSA